MDAHRDQYHAIRDAYTCWLDELNLKLAAIDPDYTDTPGKRGINRINNNLFHYPNKPTYKDHVGAGLDQITKQNDFYIELGLDSCFIASGYWNPDRETLRNLRDAIDYDGDKFKKILRSKQFKTHFPGVHPDPNALKTAPQGFSPDHEHIDLLRLRSINAVHELTRDQVLSPDFQDHCVDVYKSVLPFRRYLYHAVHGVEE